MSTSRRQSVLGLFGSWVVYWALLAAVKLGPAALAMYHATRLQEENAASIGVNLSNFVLSLVVSEHGQTTWSGAVHLVALALWIAGVPLALWFGWLYTRRSAAATKTTEQQRV